MLRQITRLTAELALFPESSVALQARGELDKAGRWYHAAIERFYTLANNPEAMESILVGMRHAHAASKLIQQLDPRNQIAKKAEAETARGASLPYQLSRTMEAIPSRAMEAISAPVAAVLENVSPAIAEVVRSSSWLVPVVGGGLVIALLLRR